MTESDLKRIWNDFNHENPNYVNEDYVLSAMKQAVNETIADFEAELYKHFNSIQPHRITQSDISEIAERLKVK